MTVAVTLLFVLQLAGFYLIALLYMRLSRLDATEKQQKALMEEMEDSLALYMADVKEENDRLITELSRLGRSAGGEADAGRSAVPAARPDPSAGSLPAGLRTPKPPAFKVMDSYKAIQPKTTEVQAGGEEEASPFADIYRLHSDGLSAAEIASRLGKGKTEVELILKFKR